MTDAIFPLSGLDGNNGFVLNGTNGNGFYSGDRSGVSVSSAGDINGDGIDDIIVGAHYARFNRIGESYVVFGSNSGLPTSLDLSSLNGSNGFILRGIDSNDRLGGSVSSAGDINGDGIDDIIVGASRANPNDNYAAGESYVVFGSNSGFTSNFYLATLDGSNGFVINGIDPNDRSGGSVHDLEG